MPYVRVPYEEPRADDELVHALADELRLAPQTYVPASQHVQSSGESPDVVEEETSRGSRHVTVVWNRWAHLPIESRGRVILNAYQEAQGEEAMRQITIAMGLTQAEALRLGLA